MAEQFVKQAEFQALKKEVQEIKTDLAQSEKLLQLIDKKIDVINEKLISANTINELKIKPLEKRVEKLEDSQIWLRRAVLGSAITLIVEAIIFVVKLM